MSPPQNAQTLLVSGPAPGPGGASSGPGVIVDCACGAVYDVVAFHKLEIVGPMDVEDGWSLQLANCVCGSTIALAFDPEGNPTRDLPEEVAP